MCVWIPLCLAVEACLISSHLLSLLPITPHNRGGNGSTTQKDEGEQHQAITEGHATQFHIFLWKTEHEGVFKFEHVLVAQRDGINFIIYQTPAPRRWSIFSPFRRTLCTAASCKTPSFRFASYNSIVHALCVDVMSAISSFAPASAGSPLSI